MAITVEEKMESEAEFGRFYAYVKLTKKKAEELVREHFDVRDSKESKHYPRLHRISWEWNTVEGEISALNEKSNEYTLAEKLWIISTKNSV